MKTTLHASWLLVLAALLPPAGASPQAVAVLGRAATTPSTTLETALGRLDAVATAPFAALAHRDGRRVAVLAGGVLPLAAPDREGRLAALLAAHGAIFGIDSALEVRSTWRAGGRRAHLVFLRDGVEIALASAVCVFDGDGAFTGGRFDAPEAPAPLGGFAVAEATAAGVAQAAAAAELLARGAPVPMFAPVQAQRRWLPAPDGLVPVWQVELRAARVAADYAGVAVFVDARDASVAGMHERVDRGSGVYPFFGNAVPFTTGTGKGEVFKNVKGALKKKTSSVAIPDLALGVGAPVDAPQGLLIGRYVDIWDALQGDAFAPNLNFSFSPKKAAEFDRFDAANVYYHLTRFARAREAVHGQELSSAFSVPVLVNVPESVPNAFFAPVPFEPTNGHSPGFMAFFDMAQVLGPDADAARDPTVAAHEYTHCWLHFEQLGFSGQLHDPARAMNEGSADAFALYHIGGAVMGRKMQQMFGAAFGPGLDRHLQDDDRFPETTLESMALTQDGMPEEHRNGEIMGSLLVDLRGALGAKTAERLVFDGLAFMPRTMTAIGYQSVTPQNAVPATEDFFFACASGLVQAISLGDAKALGAVLGAATARGVMGAEQSFNNLGVFLETLPGRRVTFPSRVVRAGDGHNYFFQVAPGRTMTITLAGKGKLKADFSVSALAGGAPFSQAGKKKKTNGGKKVKQGGLVTALAGDAWYVVRITPAGGKTGAYQLTLDA